MCYILSIYILGTLLSIIIIIHITYDITIYTICILKLCKQACTPMLGSRGHQQFNPLRGTVRTSVFHYYIPKLHIICCSIILHASSNACIKHAGPVHEHIALKGIDILYSCGCLDHASPHTCDHMCEQCHPHTTLCLVRYALQSRLLRGLLQQELHAIFPSCHECVGAPVLELLQSCTHD